MGTIPASDNVFPIVRMSEVAPPSTPPTGEAHLYVKSDGLLYWKDDAGNEYAAGGDLAGHLADTTDAHDASAISAVTSGYGNSAGTDVQGVLDDFDAAITAAGGGGATSDPTVPAGGTLYDGTSTAGFSSFGTPTTFDADTTAPDHFYLSKTSTGAGNIYGATHAVGGSFPRTYTCRLDDWIAAANYQGAGLVLGDSGGKFVSWGAIFDGNDVYFQRYLWNSASSAGTNANYLSGLALKQAFRLPLWLRIIVNSTTDLDLQYSRGGFAWHELATALNPSMTIDRFGVFVYGFGASIAEAAFDWLHES